MAHLDCSWPCYGLKPNSPFKTKQYPDHGLDRPPSVSETVTCMGLLKSIFSYKNNKILPFIFFLILTLCLKIFLSQSKIKFSQFFLKIQNFSKFQKLKFSQKIEKFKFFFKIIFTTLGLF